VYLTDQTHASIARDLHALGIEPEDLVEIPTDAIHGMDIDALRERIRSDRNNGRRPAIVIGSAGTTNTGAVDPLNDLADIAAAKGMWLHVDGAYGAPAAMTERGRQRLQGLERADSLVLDPHKWLFQPYDIGCVFVRRPAVLEETFSMHPSYLIDTTAREGEVDLRDRGLELTRRARGVKLWLTLKVHGLAAIRRAIEAGLDLAEDAQRILERDPAWEVVTPAQLAIVTFARRGASAEHHRVAAATLSADGYAAVTCTKFDGRTVLRLCTLNPATTSGDLAETIRRLATLVEGLSAGPSPTVP
jgi:glutamate/tyrosine decarboxylase-like PLP-dependent enzyme